MRKEYYYFVAGLPDIGFEEGKVLLSPEEFLREAATQLDRGDMERLRLFLLPDEIGNLLDALFGVEREVQDGGLVGREAWRGFIEALGPDREPGRPSAPAPFERLPAFVAELAAEFLRSEAAGSRPQWELKFVRAFHDFAAGLPEGFLRDWFAFDRDLRNILAALAGRKAGVAYADHLVGSGEAVDKMRTSQAPDFGLGREVPLVETLSRIMDQPDVVDRERALDALRWKWIDNRNFFEYFTVDRVIGYYAQLRILDRWARLDPESGRAVFFETLSSLENSFQFPEDFSLTPRRRGNDERRRELR
jgi:hypothetical protein